MNAHTDVGEGTNNPQVLLAKLVRTGCPKPPNLKKSATIPDTAHMPGIIAEIKKRRETRIGITAPLPIKKVARKSFLRPRCHKMTYLYLFEKKLSIYFFKMNLKKLDFSSKETA